jgi:hypothetical protein
MKWTNRLGKWAAFGLALGAAGAGCLTRPVGQQPPTTKDNFLTTISQAQVDKVDLLFMIDNSSSMGDKQQILADAVPNLVTGLLKPNCVDANGKPNGATADPLGNKDNHYGCAGGTDPEFTPVSDMHIGLVSSSLGSFGGDVCPDTGRFNDHAHLLALAKGGGTVPEAAPSNFLAWFPSSTDNQDEKRHPKPPNPTGDVAKLNAAFQSIVLGDDQTGCGLEAQMESWYHFLIAPDPWVKIILDPNQQADFQDVDIDLLKQRAAFLRSDSLVAIILLTDEDDSSPDPLSVGGQGWAFDANQFPGSQVFRGDGKTTTAPRGTSACAQNPGSPDCTSCGFAQTCNASDPACQKIKNDPNCQKNGGYYGPTEDQLNVRYQRMKERYGIDPQYPIKRYVDGLTKPRIPDRANEHPVQTNGGKRQIGGYTPVAKCGNPLFSRGRIQDGQVVAGLPSAPGDELCNLVPSTRTADLVFFAVVGGVPNQLLYKKKDGSNADDNTPTTALDPAQRVTPPNWKAILGTDPLNFNYDGIDPHMIQSISPRPNLPAPTASDTADIINGREWDTASDDLQYACVFDLPGGGRTCQAGDNSCDCNGQKKPPLCNGNQQIRAKAYPTVREFEVVRALGDNGIVASLCPLELTSTDKLAPTYGYNPAVAAIIDRLKNALTKQCLPQALCFDAQLHPSIQKCENGVVPCLVLAQLADPADKCENYTGPNGPLHPPAQDILDKFLEQQRQASGNTAVDGGTDLSKLPVCEVPQKADPNFGDCSKDPGVEWCYLTGASAGKCPQALVFSQGSAALGGARFSLQCIEQFSPGQAAGDQPAP